MLCASLKVTNRQHPTPLDPNSLLYEPHTQTPCTTIIVCVHFSYNAARIPGRFAGPRAQTHCSPQPTKDAFNVAITIRFLKDVVRMKCVVKYEEDTAMIFTSASSNPVCTTDRGHNYK